MQDDRLHDLRLLFDGLSAAFRREARPGGQHAARALEAADLARFRAAPSASVPGDLLDAAAALPDPLPLVSLVQSCRAWLDWTCWEGTGLAADISRRLFTTEILGPDGCIPAPDLRVGLLVSAPWTDYPLSRHSGEETYLVLAGTAEWALGDSGYEAKPPGSFVHHPAWAVHGRRTADEPFLGAWRWSGDLDLTSFSVEKGKP